MMAGAPLFFFYLTPLHVMYVTGEYSTVIQQAHPNHTQEEDTGSLESL